jgi:hypothetical protein
MTGRNLPLLKQHNWDLIQDYIDFKTTADVNIMTGHRALYIHCICYMQMTHPVKDNLQLLYMYVL